MAKIYPPQEFQIGDTVKQTDYTDGRYYLTFGTIISNNITSTRVLVEFINYEYINEMDGTKSSGKEARWVIEKKSLRLIPPSPSVQRKFTDDLDNWL